VKATAMVDEISQCTTGALKKNSLKKNSMLIWDGKLILGQYLCIGCYGCKWAHHNLTIVFG
jgi:hypothetical protein